MEEFKLISDHAAISEAARIPSAVLGPSYFRPLMKNVGVLFTPLRTPPA